MSGIDQRLDQMADDALADCELDYESARKLFFNQVDKMDDKDLRKVLIEQLVKDGINMRLNARYGRFKRDLKSGTPIDEGETNVVHRTNVGNSGNVTHTQNPSRRTQKSIAASNGTIVDYWKIGARGTRKFLRDATYEDLDREATKEGNKVTGHSENRQFYEAVRDLTRPNTGIPLGNKPKVVKAVEKARDAAYGKGSKKTGAYQPEED